MLGFERVPVDAAGRLSKRLLPMVGSSMCAERRSTPSGEKRFSNSNAGGIDLQAFEGIQVVCQPGGGVVLTVYRNRDFPGMRPYRRHLSGSRLPFFAVSDGIPAANN